MILRWKQPVSTGQSPAYFVLPGACIALPLRLPASVPDVLGNDSQNMGNCPFGAGPAHHKDPSLQHAF